MTAAEQQKQLREKIYEWLWEFDFGNKPKDLETDKEELPGWFKRANSLLSLLHDNNVVIKDTNQENLIIPGSYFSTHSVDKDVYRVIPVKE